MPVTQNRPRRGARAFAFPRGRAGRVGTAAAAILGGLVALDLLGFVATIWFGAELVEAAEAAGVAGLLPR